MAVDFVSATSALSQMGLADVILPFILFFTIAYAILMKIPVLPNKKYNIVIAISFAFLAMLPHFVATGFPFDPVNVVNAMLPTAVIAMLIMLTFFLILGIGGGGTSQPSVFPIIAFFLAAIALLYSFFSSFMPELFPGMFDFLGDPVIQSILIIIGVAGLVIWFVQSEPEIDKDKKPIPFDWAKFAENWFGKKP